MFSVFVRQAEQSIHVDVGSTILETALQADIDYPHGCRAGNCGGCKSRLHSGEVELSPYSEFALSAQEYTDGFILACRAVPWSDCEVSWCEQDDVAVHPVLDLTCQVIRIEKLTSDIVSLKLNITNTDSFAFSPGQFVYVEFEGYPKREYSIAGFQDNTLEFYIRKIPDGAVSTFVWDYLETGETVGVSGPHGNMFFREQHQGPVLALAGGSGLSAIQPIVLESMRQHPQRSLRLYHGVRDEPDVYRAEIFQDLSEKFTSFEYCPVLSQASGVTKLKTGLLSDVLDQELEEFSFGKAYLAGPPPMVRSCAEVLADKGMDSMDIHADPFFTEADQVYV